MLLPLRSSVISLVGSLAVWSLGCQQTTTEKDVSKSREKAREEQRDVQQAELDAEKKISDKAQEAREIRGYRQSEIEKKDQEVREARREGDQKILKEQREADDAQQKLRETQRKFASEQSRKDFVNQAEAGLNEVDQTIDRLKKQADTATPARKTTLQQKTDAVKQHRDHVKDTLKELKSADVNSWFHKHAAVDQALRDLRNAMNMPE
jgi:chromosome segregation ATPase